MAKALHPETGDVRPRAIVLFGLGLLIFVALVAIALKLLFNTTPYWPLMEARTKGSEANPALQRSPGPDLAAFRTLEDKELGRLAWVDRSAGIARIPIEDAMKLIAVQGLPDWGRQAGSAAQDCALLEGQVPRVSQARNCPAAVGGTSPADPARHLGTASPINGAGP
ncbi:hypothetical protein [Mesorhizobium sp. M0488]|uniref:hypothetical protein n=1 Tax=unclassified Mesorhizobium TaxID=325217 RepID=UPI00333A8EF4